MITIRLFPIFVCLLVQLLLMPVNLNANDLDVSPTPTRKRPNILWITSEDNSAFWLGCYGNPDAQTPRLDALANSSIQFTRAYANAPVCAVARSTLLTGVYAVTQGTQHMRSRYAIDESFQPYVNYLREQGYYCTNNSKTDFNIRGDDRAIWDECSGQAHYRNRPQESPFFAIFNLTVSHESSLFPQTVKRNRAQSVIPKQTRLNPLQLSLPPYLPDLPEIRNDFAIYHDVLSALDKRVGELLDELESAGLADDTIVFYFADHGGPTPRGKRYLEDTGTRIPLLVRVPRKFQELSDVQNAASTDELVSFVDFAPTLISIVGLEPPQYMQGRAFLGTHRKPPPNDPFVFLYADRFDELVGMRRGLTDGRYKYIRQFAPHLTGAPYSYYPLSMPGWSAWQLAATTGKLDETKTWQWQTPQPVEALFDLKNDPWEINNLAMSPQHLATVETMRQRLMSTMIAANDSGVIAEGLFENLVGDRPITEWTLQNKRELAELISTAFAVHTQSAERMNILVAAIHSDRAVVRYWGLVGSLMLNAGELRMPAISDALTQSLEDSESTNRILAARAIFNQGAADIARTALARELESEHNAPSTQLLLNTITDLELEDIVSNTWIERVLADPSADEYHKRMATRWKAKRHTK